MSEINWDLAPEGANEIKSNGEIMRFFNGEGQWWHALLDEWNNPIKSNDWQTIATRPQTKTVADAYEWADGEWQGLNTTIWYSEGNGELRWGGEVTEDTVCTREQFEVYAKEQEAKSHFKATRENLEKIAKDCEGKNWTHTYYNNLCLIVAAEPDRHGYIAIKTEKAGYQAVDKDAVKPIKPKLTKAQAWDMCQDYEGHKSMKKYMYDLYEQYEII